MVGCVLLCHSVALTFQMFFRMLMNAGLSWSGVFRESCLQLETHQADQTVKCVLTLSCKLWTHRSVYKIVFSLLAKSTSPLCKLPAYIKAYLMDLCQRVFRFGVATLCSTEGVLVVPFAHSTTKQNCILCGRFLSLEHGLRWEPVLFPRSCTCTFYGLLKFLPLVHTGVGSL